MTNLYEAYLPLIQSINEYGGNFTFIHIRKFVLDAIDNKALSDPSIASVRDKLNAKMRQWSGLQDHRTFSEFFEAYFEGVFYLTALERQVALKSIPAGRNGGKTPDFTTAEPPAINFEVKTINVADPNKTYDQSMIGGLDSHLEAAAEARQSGLGIAARSISPHGTAKNRREVVEQVMSKIDSNVKAGQYEEAPTFLVVSLARTALHDDAKELRRSVPWQDQAESASGQLYSIAAHQLDEPFYFFPEWGEQIENLGTLNRAGLLRDHEFIAGIIFLAAKWGADDEGTVANTFKLNGIWNSAWAAKNNSEATVAAKTIFNELCDAWNDMDDSQSAALPVG
jgi:hypothetical protein